MALGQRLDPIVINAFTYPANYGTTTWGLDFVVPPSWPTSTSAVTPQTFFVRIVDASGASCDPNDVRPVLYLNL